MDKLDIVYLYCPTWDNPVQLSKHHMARYWAGEGHRVLYVETPPNPLSFLTRRQEATHLWRRYRRGPDQVAENLWVHTFFYPLPYRGSRLGFGGTWVNTFNQAFIRPQMQSVLDRLGFRQPVFLLGCCHGLPLANGVRNSLLAYHCSDDYTLIDGFPESFPQLEEDLIRRSDLVIATAEELRQSRLRLNPNTFTVTNGAQIEHFLTTQAPEMSAAPELDSLSGPVAGFVGSISSWIDQDWIVEAARQLPDWNFVFIGPIHTDVSRLKTLPNLHFLGPRPYKEIPRYLRRFDVATLPFEITDFTRRVSPIKVYEYLAAGIPIVASRLPDLEIIREHIALVDNAAGYAQALPRVLAEETPEARRQRMEESKNHSWEARFRQLDLLLEQALETKERTARRLSPLKG